MANEIPMTIGRVGRIDHGKTTLTAAIASVLAEEEREMEASFPAGGSWPGTEKPCEHRPMYNEMNRRDGAQPVCRRHMDCVPDAPVIQESETDSHSLTPGQA